MQYVKTDESVLCNSHIMETNENGSTKGGNLPPLIRFHQTLPCGMRYLLTTHLSKYREAILHLQSIGKSLVQLGDLGGDAEVDGAVTDLDNESTDEVRVDLELVRMRSSSNY